MAGHGLVTQRSVDVYVRKLREKIERRSGESARLLTVRGAGYRFEADREEQAVP